MILLFGDLKLYNLDQINCKHKTHFGMDSHLAGNVHMEGDTKN